jgi:hypothetical protein
VANIRNGFIPFATATHTQLQTHSNDNWRTLAGHERWLRMHHGSTQPDPPMPPPIVYVEEQPPAWWTPQPATAASVLPDDFCFVRRISPTLEATIFVDAKYRGKKDKHATARYHLVFSSRGFTHVEPCNSELGADVAAAYEAGLEFFDKRERANPLIAKSQFVRIDNATSPEQRAVLQRRKLILSFVPVSHHGANIAEKDIQDWESHYLSALTTVAHDFPYMMRAALLPQIEIVFNHFKPWKPEPSISAWQGLYGERYDFAAHPMHVLGAKVYFHVLKEQRTGSDPRFKVKAGWYVGPALTHHRGANVLTLDAGGNYDIQPKHQLSFDLPPEFRTPRLSREDELSINLQATTAVIKQLIATGQPHPSATLASHSADLRRAVASLQNLFETLPVDDIPPPSSPPSSLHLQQQQVERVRRQTGPPAVQWTAPAALQRVPPAPQPQSEAPPAALPALPVSAPVQPVSAPVQPVSAPVQPVSAPVQPVSVPVQPTSPTPVTIPLPARQRVAPAPSTVSTRSSTRVATLVRRYINSAIMVPSRLRQFGNRAAQAHAASVITLTQPTPVLVPKDTDIKSLFAANRKLDLLIDEERKGNWSDIFCGGDGTDSDPAIATAALNLTADGKKLNFARAMQGPDSAVWQQSNDKELRKLIKDTGTMRATLKTNIPQDRRRDISYYSPQTREKIKEDALQQRVRGTYGGNLQRYSGRTSAKTTELAVSKVQFNKVVSLNRQFSSIDLTDFYLSEFLPTPEYLSIPLRIFSDAILDELNLRSFIVNGCICFEVVKTMYGLKQSGYLAQQGLIKHLNLHGYTQDQWVPMLFSDSRSDLQFTLTVDDFGIDWDDSASDADYDHLKAVLELKYAITEQKVCTKHLGMTLDYDRSAGTLSLSMPGYISQLLEQHTDRPLSFQQTPALYTPVQYGTKGAQQVTVDPTPAATDIAKQQLQSIVGSLLYYARAVDPSLMTAVCALSAQQSNPTEAATAAADRLLGYVAAYPDNQLVYRSSDMQLKFASDASHNSRPKGRSVGGGIIYAGDADNNNINGAIDAFSSVIGVVVMSAYEAEVAALYMTMQRCEWLRQVFSAFGFKQGPTPGVTDNEVAISFAMNTCTLSKSKSIDIRFHWIRDRISQGHFTLSHVPGIDNIADFFTKALSIDDHHRWLPLLVRLLTDRLRTTRSRSRVPTPSSQRAALRGCVKQ